jgi:murein DD-endopeptidase MepM/ murein hydrolase activator NlpD
MKSPARTQRWVINASILILSIGVTLLVMSQLPIASGQSGPATPDPTQAIDLSATRPISPQLPTPEDIGMLQRSMLPITETTQADGSPARRELFIYTVRDGDTLFGIAGAFGLRPETILWSNYKTLRDNPDLLSIGQELVIPPVDGLVTTIEAGDTIEALARRFKVSAGDIVDEPINKLGNIAQVLVVGQDIFVPGGERETVTWQIPQLVEIKRNVVTGVRTYRTGRCGDVAIPGLGSGNFVWPANRHYLSGNNFSSWHAGLDIAGRLGEPIYASDSGTVIYAGYSLNAAGVPAGYGQYVVLDHGNGYQTLYAHASQLYVQCGQQVARGAVIAAVGSIGKSTGPHLHFEIRAGSGGAINPWNVLPAP